MQTYDLFARTIGSLPDVTPELNATIICGIVFFALMIFEERYQKRRQAEAEDNEL